MLEHCDSDSVLIISGRRHEESMQQLINDSLNVGTNLQLICLRQVKCTTSLHRKLSDLWVFIIEEIQD
jgi:hypothetical protein